MQTTGHPAHNQDSEQQIMTAWRTTSRINVPTRKGAIAGLLIDEVKKAKNPNVDYIVRAQATIHSPIIDFAVVFNRGESLSLNNGAIKMRSLAAASGFPDSSQETALSRLDSMVCSLSRRLIMLVKFILSVVKMDTDSAGS